MVAMHAVAHTKTEFEDAVNYNTYRKLEKCTEQAGLILGCVYSTCTGTRNFVLRVPSHTVPLVRQYCRHNINIMVEAYLAPTVRLAVFEGNNLYRMLTIKLLLFHFMYST